jgi:hypothetical protein
MLDVFFLLTPGEQNERIAFLQHFHMNLDYKARALLQTVKGNLWDGSKKNIHLAIISTYLFA